MNRTPLGLVFMVAGLVAWNAGSAAAQPADQAAFTSLPQELSARTNAAPNSIVQQQMRKDASKIFCEKFQKMAAFRNWTAVVKGIYAHSFDNTAQIKLDIGNGISLEQDTDSTTPLYKVMSGLREGQAVSVTGSFDHDNDNSACIYYYGPFEVHLTSIKPTS